jgi:hypothetical protein
MIPLLGIPIIKNFHWIKRLIDSIDFPINKVVLLNNNSDDKDLSRSLDSLEKYKNPYINVLKICHLPSNIGVAASWNLIIKSDINASYWLIANSDICFTSGLLHDFHHTASSTNNGMIHANCGDFDLGSYDLFLIKDFVVQKIGLFDDNFYPAYCEDIDYILRITRYNWNNPTDQINKICSLGHPYFHGDEISTNSDYYIKGGGQTKKISDIIANRLEFANIQNFTYLDKKWGPNWRHISPSAYAMNIENIPIGYTSYDLDFCRSKYIDFA